MAATSCKQALERFARKDFASWTGLPAACTLADLSPPLSVDAEESPVRMGQGALSSRRRVATLPGYALPVGVWLRDGHVVMLDVERPELPNPAALFALLGTPDARLTCHLPTIPVPHPEGEVVFARLGLTLILSADKTNVTRVLVYAPTTVEEYRMGLYVPVAPREFD